MLTDFSLELKIVWFLLNEFKQFDFKALQIIFSIFRVEAFYISEKDIYYDFLRRNNLNKWQK